MRVLKVPLHILAALQAHAHAAAPHECVGLLFGRGDSVARYAPLHNASDTPEGRFFADPVELLRALQAADVRGDALLAVYHSHPQGPGQLSADDLAQAQADVVQVLLTPERVRAFWLAGGEAQEVRLELV